MTDERILELLSYGLSVDDVASGLVDDDVASGEYEGCSTEMELAFIEHRGRVRRVLDAAGG